MTVFNAISILLPLLAVVHASPVSSPPGLSLERRDGIPDCNDRSKTYSGPYYDGQGDYVTSDKVSHPYKFPRARKCWYDYFAVSADTQFLPWEKASGNVYCTGTDQCRVDKLTGSNVCQTRTTEISASVGADIEGFTFGVSVTLSESDEKCTSATDTTACTWTDAGCHTVWTQQQVFNQHGYYRQRCNWGNGDETDCMADWIQTTPTMQINYGCGSACSDTNTCGNTNGENC